MDPDMECNCLAVNLKANKTLVQTNSKICYFIYSTSAKISYLVVWIYCQTEHRNKPLCLLYNKIGVIYS